MLRLPVSIAAVLLLAMGSALAATQVEIPTGDMKLRAMLYRPDGPGPFPAIVALHTCDGLGDGDKPIAPRYQEWGERLMAAGFAILFPDSFGSRGLTSQCRVRQGAARASRQRTGDANAARHWLQTQPWVIADRVSLLGWSHGATTVLWTVRRRPIAHDKTPDFRSAVALYPNCTNSRISAWSARIPTLILAGRADDWTPASICEQMVVGARGRSAGTSLLIYPGAYHDFDRADEPLRERSGIANSPHPGGHVHVGTNPDARADAIKRVPEWFAR
jgi:dienelactone hydrolase